MASIRMDQTEGRKKGSGKPPVSAHPAFPAIVALWFAALLGIGTLIVPVQVIEQIVTATGIASVVPSAAPPLGFTARAGIALVATLLGAIIGFVAARRMGASANAPLAIVRKDNGMRALNPVEDMDDDFLDDELPPLREMPAPLGRRRPLAIAEDDARSDFLDVAPLPGEGSAYDLDDDALELNAEYHSDDDDFSALPEQSVTLEDHADQPQERQEFIPLASAPQASDELEVEEVDQEIEAASPVEIERVASSTSAHANTAANPLPFSPPSLARQAETESAPEEITEQPASSAGPDEEPTDEVSVPDTSVSFAGDSASYDAIDAFVEDSSVDAGREEETTGLVQLVQKLGSTLEKHREWSAQRAAAAQTAADAGTESVTEAPEVQAPEAQPVADEIPREFAPAAPDEAAEAMAAYFSKPASEAGNDAAPYTPFESVAATAQPASAAGTSYQPFAGMGRLAIVDDEEDESEDDAHELAASFTLPIMVRQDNTADQAPSPRPAFDIPPADAPAPEPESAADEVAADSSAAARQPASDASYRSLSEMDNPFKKSAQEFVRVEEPEPEAGSAEPAVLFPNQQAHKPSANSAAEHPAAAGQRAFDPPTGAPVPVPAPTPEAAKAPRNPASHEDNEQALRAALMNLQRMAK